MSVENVLEKIDKCANFEMLFCLEEDFNSIGMTLQPTKQNKMVLCMIENGVPSARRMFEDYIHIGSLEDRSEEIPGRLRECIREFAEDKATEASKVAKTGRSWQNAQTSLYADFAAIGAEFHAPKLQEIADEMTDEPVVQPRPTKGYWNSAVMSVTNISENMDKIPEKKVLSEDSIKKIGELLED